MKRTVEQLSEDALVAIRATLPAKEAAVYVGVSYWLLLEMVKRKEIPHIRLGGNRILFRKETLDAWLSEQESTSVAKPELVSGKIRRLK